MNLPTQSYEEWMAGDRDEIVESYRHYVRDTLDDEGFDITMLEDFNTWSREEHWSLFANLS